jgi:hypothetical protein
VLQESDEAYIRTLSDVFSWSKRMMVTPPRRSPTSFENSRAGRIGRVGADPAVAPVSNENSSAFCGFPSSKI